MTSKGITKRSQRPLFAEKPSYALTDPATALASIFRPVASKGHRERGLIVKVSFDGFELTFRGAEVLDARDQSALLACCALAAMSGLNITRRSRGKVGKLLWENLSIETDAEAESSTASTEEILEMALQAATFDTTSYQLLTIMDMPTNALAYQRLAESLERLASTTCIVKRGGYTCSMNLLSFASAPDGALSIAINPKFTAAFTGQHIKTSIEERNLLKTDISRLTHALLTARVREGGIFAYSVPLLSQHTWGGVAENSATERQRWKQVRDALSAINDLEGWRIEITGTGKASKAIVSRAKRS